MSRPAYRPFRVRVLDRQPLGPRFVRVTLGGGDLAGFATGGPDRRVKLLLPRGGRLPDLAGDGDWYAAWRALPDDHRAPFRTFTVRRVDPTRGRLEIDFVEHGGTGPAARWLAEAAPGSEVIVVGPDACAEHAGIGVDWRPGPATDLLLVGDETAVPAIAAILETRPAPARATVFVEAAGPADEIPLPGAKACWLVRDPAAPGARLLAAVDGWLAAKPFRRPSPPCELEAADGDELLWDSPDAATGSFYAWVAGEAGVVRELRRLLLAGHGVDRRSAAFLGYWRRGRAELA